MKFIVSKIKSGLKNFFKHPFVSKVSKAIHNLLLLGVGTCMIGILTSSIYLPVRLYFTGYKLNDVVKSISCSMSVTTSGTIEICDIVGQTNYTYEVNPSESRKLKIGNTIRVFASKKLQKGIYLKNSEPTLFNILFNFQTFGFLFILYAIALLGLLAVSLFYSFREVITQIKNQIEEELVVSHKPISKPIAYSKSYLILITGTAFSYAFSFLLVKGVYSTENGNEIICGIVLILGLSIVLYTPIAFHKIKDLLINTKRKNAAYILQFISFSLGLYSTIELFIFLHTVNFTENKNLLELLKKFVESLIP